MFNVQLNNNVAYFANSVRNPDSVFYSPLTSFAGTFQSNYLILFNFYCILVVLYA